MRRKPAVESQRRGLRVAGIVAVVGMVIAASVFAVRNRLGPFPFGISRIDTTLLTLWDEGKYDEVLSKSETVLAERPLDTQALTFGGFAHFYVGIDLAVSEEQQSHLQRSITLLRKAEHVQHAPLAGERSYVLAKAYYHSDALNLDVSVRYMEKSILDGYMAADTHSYLGLATEEMGDYSASAEWYEAGLTLRESAAMRLKASGVRVALSEFEAAEFHIRTALDSNSDDYLDLVLQVELAAILILRNELSEAESLLIAIVENNSDSADAYYYLGVVLERTNRPVEARSLYRRAWETDPDHLKALESLASWEG